MPSANQRALLWHRSQTYRAAPGRIDRDSRQIHNAAVITVGEALGHDEWVDAETLAQVAALATKASRSGIKGRFTHPGLCADGLGKHLGRWNGFRIEGNKVLAYLQLADVADTGPEGKLGEYVMDLAEEDPEAFGTSIVFKPDEKAMEAFMAQNRDKSGAFKSPDPANKGNLPHMRLSQLRAVDVVDDPAANPGGFFSDGEEFAAKTDAVLAWAFGLSDRAPQADDLNGLEPQRVRAFATRFLDSRKLALCPVVPVPATEGTDMAGKAEVVPAPVPVQLAEEPKEKPEVKAAASPDGDEPKKIPSEFMCAKCGAKHTFALAEEEPEEKPHAEPDGDEAKASARPVAEKYSTRFEATISAAGLNAEESKRFHTKHFGKPLSVVNDLAQEAIASRAVAVGEAGAAPPVAEGAKKDDNAELTAHYNDPRFSEHLKSRFPTVEAYLAVMQGVKANGLPNIVERK